MHLGYATPGGFHAQLNGELDGELFLPRDWAEDRDRCRACGIPDDVVHRPKWKIALALDDRRQRYVGEVPSNFVGWCKPPKVRPAGSRRRGVRKGPRSKAPGLTGDIAVSRVDDLCHRRKTLLRFIELGIVITQLRCRQIE